MATRRSKKAQPKRKSPTKRPGRKTARKTIRRAKPAPAPERSNCVVLRIHGLRGLAPDQLAAMLAGMSSQVAAHLRGTSAKSARTLFTPNAPCEIEGCLRIGEPFQLPDGTWCQAYLCAGEYVVYPL